MNRNERIRYHQIHPAKLATDWSFGLVSLIAFWNDRPVLGTVIAFGPSLLVSYLLVSYGDLSRYKHSSFGQYMTKHLSGWLHTVRLGGFALMIVGAWYHDLLIVALGIALILLAWLNGLFVRAIHLRSRNALPFINARHRIPPNLPR